MVLSSNITWIFPDENSGSANGNTTTLTTVLHVWYCHHPGSKLWTWDSFLSPGKASSLPQCAVLPFPPRLLSWFLSVWVMMWMELLVFTNSGGNLSCSTNLGKLLKGPCVWVLRCVSWRWLCICQRPRREDAGVFWTGFAESQKQRNTPEKQFVIIFCFYSKTFWSVFSKDSVQLKWHILSVRVCVSLSTWLSKTVSNCSLFRGNYLNTCQMEEKSTQCFQVQVHVLFVRYNR